MLRSPIIRCISRASLHGHVSIFISSSVVAGHFKLPVMIGIFGDVIRTTALICIRGSIIRIQRISQAWKFSSRDFLFPSGNDVRFPQQTRIVFVNSNDIRISSFAVSVFFSADASSRDDVCPPLRRRLDRFHLHNFYEICIVSSRATRCFSRRRLLLLDAVITTRRRGLPPPSAVLSQFRYDIFVVFILTFSANSITTTVVVIRRRSANAYTMSISFINQAELWIVPVVFFPHRR
mmetsp:Transcript_8559/g.27428  ORF Transcript_8559/g.27428 Transcript_8559/m.27428 type:complete len:235 (-) Transcript_8559:339-1043(-)